MIVTIDGPAGAGKSTAARGLARRLGFQFLDTGAMYRAVALVAITGGVDPADEPRVTRIAERTTIRFDSDRIFADGRDVTELIRTPEVSSAASVVAQIAGVRSAMVARQRELATGIDVVTEGRDQGTVAFPDAECKFFLTADPAERALRRKRDFAEAGDSASLEETLEQIHERDHRDAHRAVAPLKAAPDALHVDTSTLTIDEVLDVLEQTVRNCMHGQTPSR